MKELLHAVHKETNFQEYVSYYEKAKHLPNL